jgi:hypothetical protein
MASEHAPLDAPFSALAAFDWGGDPAALAVIDQAVVAAHGDPAVTADLEKRLAGLLGSDASLAAKQYACRKLSLIGTAASVPAVAALLTDTEMSHMARFALERYAAPEAGQALRQALGEVAGDLAIGMVASLAARRDLASVPAIAALVTGDSPVASAAADALGIIATPEAAETLATARVAGTTAEAVVDARLACAEALVAAGHKAEAKALYQAVAAAVADTAATRRGRAVRMACQRGVFAAMGG